MPEVTGPGPVPTLEQLSAIFAAMPAFTCGNCHAAIEQEPKCAYCERCIVCCTCVVCPVCERSTTDPCATCHACSHAHGDTPACCSCRECTRCRNRFAAGSRFCPECGLCKVNGCCMCWVCSGCAMRYGRNNGGVRSCRSCRKCLECCRCLVVHFMAPDKPTFHLVPVGETDPRTENQRIGPPPAYRTENPSHRFLSTEIEVSDVLSETNRNTAKVLRKWGGAIVSDGSVGAGFEINTAPAAGDVFGIQIREICEALEQDKCAAGSAAGAHVHIDARDFKYYDIRRLVFLYEKVENALYGIVAPARARSNYAAPCGALYSKNLREGLVPKENKVVLLKNMYNIAKPTKDIARFKRDKGAANRYHGLNLHSWMFRGTIECRIMHGSTSATKLINWGILWAALLDRAMKMRESDIIALRDTPLNLLLDIAPTDEVRQWVENRWAFFHRNRR